MALDDVLKNLAIGTSSLATGAAGAIPSLISLAASGGQKLSEFLDSEDTLIGEFLDPKDKLISKYLDPKDTLVRDVLGGVKELAEKATPEALQGYLGEATGGYLTPKTRIQKGVSRFATDAGSVLGLGGSPGIALRMAGLGNAAYQGAKSAGFSEPKAEFASLLSMMSSPLFRTNQLKSFAKSLFSNVSESITPKTSIKVPNVKNAAKELLKNASKGSTSWRRDVKRFAKDLFAKTKKNSISVDELWTFSTDLNEKISRGTFQKKKYALMKPIQKEIKDSLSKYGEINKTFGENFTNANMVFSINENLPILDRAINKTLGLKNSGLGEYFRKSLVYGMGGIKGLLAKEVLGAMSKRTEAFLRSPAYRKNAIDLAKAASKQSIPQVVNSLRKLEKFHENFEKGLTNKQGESLKIIDTSGKLGDKSKPIGKSSGRDARILTPEEAKKIMQKK